MSAVAPANEPVRAAASAARRTHEAPAAPERDVPRPARVIAVPGRAFAPRDSSAAPTVRRVFATVQAAGQALTPPPAGMTRVRNTDGLGALSHPNVLWSTGGKAALYTKYWGDELYYLSPLVAGRNDDGAPANAFFARIRSSGQAAGFCDAAGELLAGQVDYAAGWVSEPANPALTPDRKHRDDLETLIAQCSGNIHSSNIHTVVGGIGAKGKGVKKVTGVDPSARIDVQNPPGPERFNVHFQVGGGSEACVVFHVSDPKAVVLAKLLESFDNGLKMISPRAG